MRRMSEDSVDLDASFIDGVKVDLGDAWVLVLPDQHRPLVQIVVEAAEPVRAEQLLDEYRRKVEGWKLELMKAG
jgi:mannose-1-phosphate guanylyltransferase/phosphomannomutase